MDDKATQEFFAEFNSIVWKTYDTFSALSSFTSFWKEAERLVTEAADTSEKSDVDKWNPGSGDEATDYFEARRMARHLHDEIVTPTFRYGAVITLFSVIERELKRFAETLAKEEKHEITYRDLKGGLMQQLSRYTEVYCEFRLNELKAFSAVRDLQRVRNCLVHGLGDPALMAAHDKDALLLLNDPQRGLEVYEGTAIVVSPAFIDGSIQAAHEFFFELFQRVGWKVNDRWLKVGPKPPPRSIA